MSPLDRFVDACLRSAARRWSDDTMLAEWRAELAHLPRRGNAVRRLAYAVSLACAPAPRSDAAPWSVRLAPATRAVLGWAGVALLAATLAGTAQDPLTDVFRMPYAVADAVGVACSIAAMAWIGSRARVAAVVPMMLVLGLVTWTATEAAGANDPLLGDAALPGVPAFVVWAGLTGIAVAAAGRLARRGRRVAAWLTGTAGALIAADIGVAVLVGRIAARVGYGLLDAPLWAAYGLVPVLPNFDGRTMPTQLSTGRVMLGFDQGFPAVGWLGGEAGQVARPMLYCGVFVLAATIVVARRANAVPAAVGPARSDAAAPARGRWHGPAVAAALAAFAVGTGTWAYLRSLVPPPPHNGRIFDYGGLPGDRVVAALTVTLALAALLALTRRGPVAVPAVAAFAVLLAVEVALDRTGVRSPAVVVVAAVAAGAGAVALSGRLPSARPDGPGRALAFVAVAATMAIPTGLNIFAEMPTGVIVVRYATAAALWVLAALCALAARTAPMRIVTGLAILVGGLAAVIAAVPDEFVRRLYWPDPTLLVQVPLAVLLVAVIRAPGARWRWWAMGAVATVATVVVARALHVPVEMVDLMLARAVGDPTVSGPAGGGVILLGVAVAALVARPAAAPPAAESDLAVVPVGA